MTTPTVPLPLITTPARLSWIFDGDFAVMEHEESLRDEIGIEHEKVVKKRIFALRRYADELVASGVVIVSDSPTVEETFRATTPARLAAGDFPKIDLSDVDTLMDGFGVQETHGVWSPYCPVGWVWILEQGVVYDRSEFPPVSTFGRNLELFHLIECGVDNTKSGQPHSDYWEVSVGYEACHNFVEVTKALLSCRCGEISHLEVGIPVTSK